MSHQAKTVTVFVWWLLPFSGIPRPAGCTIDHLSGKEEPYMERYEKAEMKVIEIKDDVITTSGETQNTHTPPCNYELCMFL